MEIDNKVLEVLKASQKPLKSAEIASSSGISKEEVDKAIKKLKKADLIFSPKNCFYQAH
jgi:DNA-binding IscR family transcriptional regulator